LQRVSNRTRVVIVQHPRETFHPLNTVRIAEGCLRRVDVVRGAVHELDERLRRLSLPPDTALLFPSRDAEDLESLAPDERPSTVVVLDGTWAHARALQRDCPSLAHLRKVRFTPPAPSEYRIRREPRSEYLSTVESVAHVLERLEPETPGVGSLRHGFRSMIDRAVHARSMASDVGRSKRPRHREPRLLPPALSKPPADIVVVYAEWSASAAGSGRFPLLCVARRLGETAAQRLLLQTPTAPHPRLLEHLAVDPAELEAALEADAARSRWQTLVRPGDTIAVWHRSTLKILDAAGFAYPDAAALKELYCNHPARRGVPHGGGLEDVLVREGALWPPAPLAGRAGERLTQTETALQFLRDEARRDEAPQHETPRDPTPRDEAECERPDP
jgi:DTW domain-containing protein YfiP